MVVIAGIVHHRIVNSLFVAHLKKRVCVCRIFNSGYDCRNRTPPQRERFNGGTFTKGFVCGGYLTVVVIAGIVHHPHREFFTCGTFIRGCVCMADI